MNAKTLEAIKRHGESLLAAFPNATEKDPIALCKKLRRIETSLTKPLTDYCNGTFQDDEKGTKLDAICDNARARVASLLMITGVEFDALHINRDPRGYALKLDDAWTREYNRKAYDFKVVRWRKPIYTDLGGYGILAPDLNTK